MQKEADEGWRLIGRVSAHHLLGETAIRCFMFDLLYRERPAYSPGPKSRLISNQIARSRIYAIEDTPGQQQLFRSCVVPI